MGDIMAPSSLNQTELWLHSRLSSEGRWDTAGIASSFTNEKLSDICEIFVNLDSKLKLKLLLSLLEIQQRNIPGFEGELDAIIELACRDPDDWVRVTGHIISHLPSSNCLKHDLTVEVDGMDDIKRQVKQASGASSACHSLPIDFPYLNRSVISHRKTTPPVKHFTLKRKPKSAALRAQLTQRETHRRPSSVTAGNVGTAKRPSDAGKEHARPSHGPLHVAKTTAPSSVFARSLASSGMRTTSRAAMGKKTKLLDITEQPITSTRELKKRKKQAETEASAEEVKAKKSLTEEQPGTSTSDQAGPKSAAGPEAAPKEAASADTSQVPSYAVLPQNVLTSGQDSRATTEKRSALLRQAHADMEQVERGKSKLPALLQEREATPAVQPTRTVPKPPAAKEQEPQPQNVVRPAQEAVQPEPPPAADIAAPVAAPGAPVKKGLSLTREQMVAAQEMFRSANCVARAEKALILGFMAGARDNPFPHQGPVITIKLSETTEEVQVPGPDGPTQQTVLVEMLFEMNYTTGHWRRLKRTRTLAQQQQQYNM